VEKLREFARLDRGEVGEVDINESIDQCLMLLSEPLTRSRIAVDRRPGDLPAIQGAASHLNQALLNLLLNGIEAIESTGRPDGRIVIETRADGKEIIVEIIDNGPGIPPAMVAKIFDPFFTTKPPGKGTGLGLSTCHGIVTEHSGQIEVESEPGTGTTFRIRLPIRLTP
jgi:signal transduction histidine kinase